MAPTKPAKPASTKPSKKPDSTSRVMKSSKKDKPKAPPAEEVKSKGRLQPGQQKKPQKKQYSEEELDLPKLNSITPVGLVKPKGKKKGKVFVDDEEGMRTILAMVNAEKEGQIESKMMKARYLEEIREAKKKETEAKQEQKKSKFEQAKDSVRHKRKKGSDADNDAKQPSKTDSKAETNGSSSSSSSSKPKKRKSVAFA